MKIIDDFSNANNQPTVATIGFFDGVHLGHRFLIDELKKEAAARKLPSTIITFAEHPQQILNPQQAPLLLNTPEEKLEHLTDTGVDCCYILNFTTELSNLSAQAFIEKVLKKRLNIQVLIIGYDHRFGHNREDGFEQYKAYGAACGIEVVKAPSLSYHEIAISSSKIREVLENGEVAKVARFLTYPYSIKGHIVSGHRIGRTIGFPTANIVPNNIHKAIPGTGVYAVKVCINKQHYNGMLSIGNRPTLNNGNDRSIEAYILDFDKDIYNQNIEIQFIEYIRDNRAFDSIEHLRKQLEQDKQTVIDFFKNS